MGWVVFLVFLVFFGFCLLLVCPLVYRQYTKGAPPQSRKKQSILFTAINEYWPSREFLVLPRDECSCGQHPYSFSVVTCSDAHSGQL